VVRKSFKQIKNCTSTPSEGEESKDAEGTLRSDQEQISEVTFAPLSCILCTASTTPSLKGSFRPTIPRE
jgi:hypothetical protein